jgi:hypothetical protein
MAPYTSKGTRAAHPRLLPDPMPDGEFRFKAFVENFDSALYCASEVSIVHRELLRILAASADESLRRVLIRLVYMTE